MKNVILLVLWPMFFVLLFVNFKLEESAFVVWASVGLVIVPIWCFLKNFFFSLNRERNELTSPALGVFLTSLIIGTLVVVFHFLPEKHFAVVAVLMWIFCVASQKLPKGGFIRKIFQMIRFFQKYTDKTELFTSIFGEMFFALSPFHWSNK